MQVYEDLSIATAKATTEEMDGIPHHMLSIIPTNDTSYSVAMYVPEAVSKILSVQSRCNVPIVCGGTFYYVEALLYDNFAASQKNRTDHQQALNDTRVKEIESLRHSGITLHKQLACVDQAMANRLHPNDHRRIQHALTVYMENLVDLPSTLLQRKQESTDTAGRFNSVCVIWLDSQSDILETRINRRVDSMVGAGLIEEVDRVYKELDCNQIDTCTGIVQAIGFKEFIPYVSLSANNRSERGLQDCIMVLKRNTLKYAKRQLQWIRNRLSRNSLGLNIYRLDTSNMDSWNSSVLQPAVEICTAFIETDEVPSPEKYAHLSNSLPEQETSQYAFQSSVANWKNYSCIECDRTLYGRLEYDVHMSSKKHFKVIRKRKRAIELQKYRALKEADEQ